MRTVIEYGLARGWQPDSRGGTFLLTERDAPALELAKFLATDRLRDPDAPDPTARVINAYELRHQETDTLRSAHRA